MGQATEQIEAHIEQAKEDLGSNLQELEQKVKSVADWKQHVRTNPMTMVGVAFGGGMLLSTIVGSRRTSRNWERRLGPSVPNGQIATKGKGMKAWRLIKTALAGVAAARVQDFVGQVIPGFQEQYQRASEKAEAAEPSVR